MSLESVNHQENSRRKNITVERSYKGQGSRGWTAVDNKAGVYNKLLSSDGFRVLTCVLSIPETQKLTQDLVIDLTGLTKYIVSKSFLELQYFGYLEVDKKKLKGKFNTDYKVVETPAITQMKKYQHPRKDNKKAETILPERTNRGESVGSENQEIDLNTTNNIIYKTKEEVKVIDNKIAKFENYRKPEIPPPPVENKFFEKEIKQVEEINPLREKKISLAKSMIEKINNMNKNKAWDFIKNKSESDLQEVINQLEWRADYCNTKQDPSTMFFKCVNNKYLKPVPKNTSVVQDEKISTPEKDKLKRICQSLKLNDWTSPQVAEKGIVNYFASLGEDIELVAKNNFDNCQQFPGIYKMMGHRNNTLEHFIAVAKDMESRMIEKLNYVLKVLEIDLVYDGTNKGKALNLILESIKAVA